MDSYKRQKHVEYLDLSFKYRWDTKPIFILNEDLSDVEIEDPWQLITVKNEDDIRIDYRSIVMNPEEIQNEI